MIQPLELKLNLPVEISNGIISTTASVWDVLMASKNGDIDHVKKLASECPELLYARYNYAPPIHFAVREGHTALVKYLLSEGAYDPGYKIYPFLDSLQTIAHDRGYSEMTPLLHDYKGPYKFNGDNGKIQYNRSVLQVEFEQTVDAMDVSKTERMLKAHPDLINDQTYFWGEGILTFPAKENNREMIDLLMKYGGKVPTVLKWTQFYYFEHYDGAVYMMEKGMNPNTMSWHHVTILHDMAQKGNIRKAELLLKYGAEIDPIDEEYQSTPLGMAVRWGHIEMVQYLLSKGANPNGGGATWSMPMAWAKNKGHKEIEIILRRAGVTD